MRHPSLPLTITAVKNTSLEVTFQRHKTTECLQAWEWFTITTQSTILLYIIVDIRERTMNKNPKGYILHYGKFFNSSLLACLRKLGLSTFFI